MKELTIEIQKYCLNQRDKQDNKAFLDSIDKDPLKRSTLDYYQSFTDWIVKDQELLDHSELAFILKTEEDWGNNELDFLKAYIKGTTNKEENSVISKRAELDSAFSNKLLAQGTILKGIQGLRKNRKAEQKKVLEAQLSSIGLFDEVKKNIERDGVFKSSTTTSSKTRVIGEERQQAASSTTGHASSDTDKAQPSIGKIVPLRRKILIAAAAAAAGLIGIRYIPDILGKNSAEIFAEYSSSKPINNINNGRFLEQERNIKEAPGAGNSPINQLILKALEPYKQAKYLEAITILGTSDNPRAEHLKALSNWQLENYSASKLTFDKLLTSVDDNRFIEVSTRWYLALLNIKDNNTAEAKKLLQEIGKERYNSFESYQKNAKQLLNEL